MENMTSTAGLKKAIELLEAEQAVKLQRLKEQFYPTYESLKPVNLLKSTLSEITSSPYLIDNIIGTALGLATGYFSKKLVVGASVNRVRRLVGTVLQFGVTHVVAQHTDAIKSFSRNILQHIFRKKERISS
jgi:hypothetical protein